MEVKYASEATEYLIVIDSEEESQTVDTTDIQLYGRKEEKELTKTNRPEKKTQCQKNSLMMD